MINSKIFSFNTFALKNSFDIATSVIFSTTGKRIFTLLSFTSISLFAVKLIFSNCRLYWARLGGVNGDSARHHQPVAKQSSEEVPPRVEKVKEEDPYSHNLNEGNRAKPSKLLKTRGHFVYNTYKDHFDDAIKVAKRCFSRIVNPKANNKWDWIYISQEDDIFKTPSLKEMEGSCFGNCCALGKAIIRRGEILSAAELQAIENSDKFPKRAMGFQISQKVFKEIGIRVDNAENTPAAERPALLTTEEKNALGKRASYFPYHRHVECLTTYGLSFEDVAELSEAEFKELYFLVILLGIPFEWAKEKIFQKQDLKTGKDLIKWASSNKHPGCASIPSKGALTPGGNPLGSYPHLIHPKNTHIENKRDFDLPHTSLQKSDLIAACPEINQSDFSGFFIIRGTRSPDSAAGHALLLEIDNSKNIYVLYDNNLGFYSGESLEDCLQHLNQLWLTYTYVFRTFFPYIFPKKA